MRISLLAALAAAASLTMSGDVLTFTDATICSTSSDGSGPMTSCPNGSAINQSYGDNAFVNVTYSVANSAVSLQRWDTGYSDLTNVAYGYFGGGTASILLVPVAGMEVTLNSFNLGTAPPNVSREATVEVTDALTNAVLYSISLTNAGSNAIGATATLLSPGVSSANGLKLTYTGDVFNIGIDNVNFDVTETPTSGVPEPSTLAMLSAGLSAALTLGSRARTSQVSLRRLIDRAVQIGRERPRLS